jgi:hypothetical protein
MKCNLHNKFPVQAGGRSALAGLVLALAAAAVAGQELPATAQEPVFGLRFPSARVQFEPVPPEVLTACPVLAPENGERVAWMLASAREDKRRVVVLGGFHVRRGTGGEAPRAEPDARGAVVDIGPGGCKLLGPARQVFDTRPPELPAPLQEQLAADLAERYGRAFGNLDHLRDILQRRRVAPTASASPLLYRAFRMEEEDKGR